MIAASGVESEILAVIEPSLTHMGYELVQVRLVDASRSRTLQILIERLDGDMLTVDDCEKVSERVSALLDVEDIVPGGAYQLEVSSPGLDRPLTRKKDFTRYAGFEAKLETQLPIEGRKRYRGILKGMENDTVVIVCDGQEHRIDFGNLHRAKLVETEAMITELLKKRK